MLQKWRDRDLYVNATTGFFVTSGALLALGISSLWWWPNPDDPVMQKKRRPKAPVDIKPAVAVGPASAVISLEGEW